MQTSGILLPEVFLIFIIKIQLFHHVTCAKRFSAFSGYLILHHHE